jgi:hypothetical protein
MNVGGQPAAELSPYEFVLSKLDRVKRCASGGATAKCPGHDDRVSSLKIDEAADGKVLMHDHGGCAKEKILAAIGLKMADLFPDKRALKAVKIVATYDYRDAEGKLVYQVVRYQPKKFKQRRPDGRGGWIWDLKGVTPLLYKLPELLSADRDEWVCIPEGEKDADRLTSLDFVATCNSGGAGKFPPEHAEHLKGRRVAIFPDNDDPGCAHARMVAEMLAPVARVVQIVEPPAAVPIKGDVSNLIETGWTREMIAELIERAPRYEASTAKPVIVERSDQHTVLSAQAWKALGRHNEPPFLFRYGGSLARIETDENGRLGPVDLTANRFRAELSVAADFVDDKFRPSKPSADFGILMLGEKNPPLPPLRRIMYAPGFTPDGRALTVPGYDRESGIYLAPYDYKVPPIPERPSKEDVLRAYGLLAVELLGDFPFPAQSDKAAALGLTVLRPARALIDGPTPLHDATAPMPGSGKGLLINATLGATGAVPGLLAFTRNEEELRKRITAILIAGHEVIAIDNANGAVDSPVLAMALTCLVWEDRVLNVSRMVRLPMSAIFTISGNNLQYSLEMARRRQRIRIVPGSEHPENRPTSDFRHPDLKAWVEQNRGDLTWAALVLIQNWIAKGRPTPGINPLGSYENWSRVIGGILECAGVGGFLENRVELAEAATTEASAWYEFVETWWEEHGHDELSSAQLMMIATRIEGFPLGSSDSMQGRRVAFGAAIAGAEDRVVGDYRIIRAGTRHRAVMWRLVKVGGGDA